MYFLVNLKHFLAWNMYLKMTFSWKNDRLFYSVEKDSLYEISFLHYATSNKIYIIRRRKQFCRFRFPPIVLHCV
jgi:hypothetical protein